MTTEAMTGQDGLDILVEIEMPGLYPVTGGRHAQGKSHDHASKSEVGRSVGLAKKPLATTRGRRVPAE